jgi:hypothetical protein
MRPKTSFFPRRLTFVLASPAPWLSGSPAPRLVLFAAALLFLAGVSLPACAYGPATVKRMADVTLRLAPVSLRRALLDYREHLDRGIEETLQGYGGARREDLLAEAEREYALIPTLPRTLEPFERIAWHFGRFAALVYLVNDPLAGTDDARVREIHQDYFAYLEGKLPLMVLTFDGYESPPFTGDVRAYLGRRLQGGGRYRDGILFCYFPDGKRVSSKTFDDQSNAFGSAQAILSHAASDAAKLWFYTWRSMEGDDSATPFYTGPPRSETRGP